MFSGEDTIRRCFLLIDWLMCADGGVAFRAYGEFKLKLVTQLYNKIFANPFGDVTPPEIQHTSKTEKQKSQK